MNILITGTDGFVGSNLKEYFTAQGFSVHGTVYFKNPGYGETRIDVRRPEDFEALRGKDFPVVIHTAGIVDQTAPRSLIFKVNAEGTKNVLSFARHTGCNHFIQMSSVSVYGRKTLGENRSEDTARSEYGLCSIPYMKSKARAERYIEESGIPYTILRLPAILGRNDSALSHPIIQRLLQGTFCFCGRKKRQISVICVKNIGPIIHRIIDAGPRNDFFHCIDHDVYWKEFIAEYAGNLGVAMPEKRKSILSMITHYRDKTYVLMVSFSCFGAHYKKDKLYSWIGFTPKFHWKEAVKDAVEGYADATNNR